MPYFLTGCLGWDFKFNCINSCAYSYLGNQIIKSIVLEATHNLGQGHRPATALITTDPEKFPPPLLLTWSPFPEGTEPLLSIDLSSTVYNTSIGCLSLPGDDL